MGVLKEEEVELFKRPYSKYSGKRTGEGGYVNATVKETKKSYFAGETGDEHDGH